MTNPEVSVVTIFLNGEAYLREAIDSVLAQDFANLELIMVDDGSTDASTEIARGYAASFPDRCVFVEHPDHANRGMSASRNAGIAVARGRYVAFIDADDVWTPEKVREQIAIFEAHPEVGMVAGAARVLVVLAGRGGRGGPGRACARPCRPPRRRDDQGLPARRGAGTLPVGT